MGQDRCFLPDYYVRDGEKVGECTGRGRPRQTPPLHVEQEVTPHRRVANIGSGRMQSEIMSSLGESMLCL
jgi:hypothetical protein